MNPLQKQFQPWRKWLNGTFPERQSAVDCLLWGLVCRGNVFMIGMPGTAKTRLCSAISGIFDGCKFFDVQLAPFTPPEEVFGPVSMKALEQDDYRRNTTGYLPWANVTLVDEIWKGSDALINMLLWPLADRKMKNGHQTVQLDLELFASASNEVPERDGALAAAWDRFFIRTKVNYLQSEDNWLGMLRGSYATPKPPQIAFSELKTIQQQVRSLKFSSEAWDALRDVRKRLNAAGHGVSDRRWVQAAAEADIEGNAYASLAKAAAWVNGRDEVKASDLSCLYDSLWGWPDEVDKVTRIIAEVVCPMDKLAQDKLNKATEIYKQIEAIPQGADGEVEALSKVLRQLRPLHNEVKGYMQDRDQNDPAIRLMLQANGAIQTMLDRISDRVLQQSSGQ